MTKNLKKLHQKAKQVRENSYSPYSKFKVGAALLTSTGEIFSGTNVENASYGGTICAERSAIFSAIAKLGKLKIIEICVVTEGKKNTQATFQPWPPCGLCRQVMAEFATAKTKIHIASSKEVIQTFKFSELLPHAFNGSHLKK